MQTRFFFLVVLTLGMAVIVQCGVVGPPLPPIPDTPAQSDRPSGREAGSVIPSPSPSIMPSQPKKKNAHK